MRSNEAADDGVPGASIEEPGDVHGLIPKAHAIESVTKYEDPLDAGDPSRTRWFLVVYSSVDDLN